MRERGTSLIEVSLGLVVLIPVVLVLIDLSMTFLAVQANDAICRKAARTAASGDPARATIRAISVIQHENNSGGSMRRFSLIGPVDVQITSQPFIRFDSNLDRAVNPGGPVNGTAKVTTEVEVKPLVVQLFFNSSTMRFQTHQTCPISYIQPATDGNQPL
jgi:Flp pilus assembly protein TadG